MKEIPDGWDHNPSSWRKRIPVVGLALVGFGIAAYLSAYQFKMIPVVWEPFFGLGSSKVLDSSVSKLLPVPDAALGAAVYLLDALTGVIGGRSRWRTMPWIVILFGTVVGPFGMASILLVIFQPVLFDAWCTLCLASAVVSVNMVGPAMGEVLASLQLLVSAKREGKSPWRLFWKGDAP
jgi:uncharacterized membrane protein